MRRSRTPVANLRCRLVVLAALGVFAPAAARAQALLPDLVVTDFWEQKGVISFTLKNEGTKTAEAGHTAFLSVDGHDVDTAYVGVTIVPGKTYTGTFNQYSWKCTASGKYTLAVRADGTDKIAELNEKNNSRQEVWTCDVTAPVITSGPTVSNITQTSARIRWTTDENSDSVVRYGPVPLQYTGTKSSQVPTTDHSLLLDNLQADTLYYFVAESTDGAGNTVRSKEKSFRTEAQRPPLPDLIVTDVWESDHLIYFRVRNAGDGTANGGHHAGLYIAERLVDSLWISQTLAPGDSTQRNFAKFYFECFDPQQTLRVTADIDDVVVEQNETNNSMDKTFTCDVTAPKIVSGPTAQEVTTQSAVIVWETDEACDSEVFYDSRASTFGQQATDAARVTQHRISLGKLTPDTVYQFKVRSTDAAGLSVSSRPGYFRTDPKAGGQAPVVKKVSFRRLDTEFPAYAMEADIDDTEVEKVEFFVDDMLVYTDYSPPYKAVLTPGIIATTRAEFFQRRPVRVVATNSSNMRGSVADMFEPAYECEQIHAEFEWPFPHEKVYIPGNTAPAGTEVPIRVYAYAWESDCHVLTGSLGGLAESLGESAIVCDFEENPVREVEFSINGSPIGVVPSGGGYVYSITWDATGFPLGEHSLRADVVGDDDCIQTITRTIEIERGTLELDVTRRVWREGNAFRIELTVHNRGTLDYACDVIHDNLIGLFAVPETYGHHEVIPMAGAGAGDCDVYLDLFDDGDNTRLIRAGHSVAVEYHAVPTLTNSYPGWADRPIGREAVEVLSSWGLPGQTFERPCVRTEDGILLAEELDDAVAAADFLIVTNGDNCQTEFGSADTVLEEMAALAYRRNGVLGWLDNWIPTGFSVPSAATIRDQIAAWGATMRGSDGAAGGYLSNGYLLLVGETEIVPAWTVDIPDIEWTNVEDPTTEVTLSDLPYADTSGADNVPELLVGRIIGNSAGALVQTMQASLDGGFDRSYGVVTSGYETDWEDFVLTAQDIYRVWFDQAGDGTSMTDAQRMHHWSAYVQKEELVSGYDFPMSADEGFLMANLGGAGVTALRVDPAADTAHGVPHSDMGLVASHFSVEFACPFDAGDGLAAGDIDGDGEDEIVRAAIGTDKLMVVHDPPSTDHGVYPAADVTLAPWDTIACGDVLGLGDDQVVLARTTGGGSIRIYEYDHSGVRRLVNTHSFSAPFTSYDSLAVGDVNATNPGAEIIVARDDGSRIYIYDSSGNTLGEIACECYTGNDGLVAADLDGDGQDEIGIVIDDTVDSKRRLEVFQHDCWSLDPNGIWQVKDDKSFLIYSRFLQFAGARTTGGSCHDGISCADLDGDGREEICIAHEHDDRLYVCDGYYSRGWKDRYLPVLQNIDDQIDVLAMSGHGNAGSCSPLNRDDINTLSLDAHPVVFAFSCLTGNYEGAGDNGLAETFLSRGAGVYIGATEVSPTTENSAAGPAFFTAWTPGDPVGKAFGNFRRSRAATGDDGWRFWALEYNYYGDPKFGAPDSASAGAELASAGIAIAAAPPLPGLNEAITIPLYEVTTADGKDRAAIPGGDVLLEDGQPIVPYYTKQWELPPGTVVQDVQLRQRSGLKTDLGLVLPIAMARVDAAGAAASVAAEPEPSWYPRKDLDWRLVPNPNGSTTLLVSLYPFFYNSMTTEVRFYEEYVIDVVTTASNVGITSLATDAVRYQPGDPVTGHLQLFGTGAAEDVFVDVAIRQYGSDELVAGLLLRRLSALSGPASFAPVWDSQGASAGLYYVDVTLANPAGEVLARRQSLFELAADAQPGDAK
jgi:hypothetical protein